MSFPEKILLLEDTDTDAELITYRLKKAGVKEVKWVSSIDEFQNELSKGYDLIVSDYHLKGFDGTMALKIARSVDEHIAFVICSGIIGEERSADIIKLGADDFVSKDNLNDRLLVSIERAYNSSQLKRSEESVRKSLDLSIQRLNTIVSNIREAIALLNVDTDGQIFITKVNPGFIELAAQFGERAMSHQAGDEPEFLDFMTQAFALEDSILNNWVTLITQAASTGKHQSSREDLLLDDGRRYVLDFNATLVDRNEQGLKQCLVTIQDVTQQVKTEEYILSSIIQAQENERQRLAHELHDGVGQYLSASVLGLNALAEDASELTATSRDRLKKAIDLINRAIHETRTISHKLVPKTIEDFGLEAALGSMIDNINSLGQIQIDFSSTLGDKRLTREIEINLYRISQEAISNIIKHSEAGSATVQLLAYPDAIILTIEDNGKGFDTATAHTQPGIGLDGMRNRVKSMGGDFDISSAPGRGTHLLINLPLTKSSFA
ncbi:MAG: hypothetical protein Kow0075_00270 [Salibacteraceae bacterium]